MFYANARSLKNKLGELEVLVYEQVYDILAFCESWLDDSIPNALLSHGLYTVIRKDRIGRVGGGVVLLIKRGLEFQVSSTPEQLAELECVIVDLRLCATWFRVAVTYRAPNATADVSSLHCKLLEFVHSVSYPTLQLGDFNLAIDWTNLHAVGGSASDFMSKVIDLSLVQLVEVPTRGINILDLALVNDPLPIMFCGTGPPFSTSDHESVMICLSFQVESPPVFQRYIFSKADYAQMNIFLANVDWYNIIAISHDCEDMCHTITAIIQEALHLFVPVSKGPRFLVPLHIRQLQNKRVQLHRQLKCGDWSVKREFQLVRNQYKMAVHNWQHVREQRVLSSGNCNALHRYAQSRRRYCEPVASLHGLDNMLQTSEMDKCNVLATYYCSVFSRDNGLQYALPMATKNKLSDVPLEPVQVYKILREMPPKTSMGPDGIPACVLKYCAVPLALPLSLLYNASLESGSVPSLWKFAHIVPIYKKGNRSDPSNYRPVSLICDIVKGLEDPMCSVIRSHCLRNRLLSPEQFGFLSGRSTTGQLIDSFDIVTKALDEGLCVDIVYLDLSKAFDSICIRKLMIKLECVGISGKLLCWLHSYLTDRMQSVKIGNSLSEATPVSSGVPQGTKLGPLLFLLYMEDIVLDIPVTVLLRLYADDIKLIYVFKSNIVPTEMQLALSSCVSWLSDRDLSVQPVKCQAFHLGRSNPHHQYMLNENVIPSVEFVSDLGVIFDKELKFSRNTVKIAKKASCVANMILRVFHSSDVMLLTRAFKTYVRPILEYACELSNPSLACDVAMLERVQRDYTRRIACRARLQYADYADRLCKLDLPLLSTRRQNACLVMYYKLLNRLSHTCHEILPLDPNARQLRRHNTKNIATEKSRLELRRRFFSCRYRNVWNALPEYVANAPSLASMKRSLRDL